MDGKWNWLCPDGRILVNSMWFLRVDFFQDGYGRCKDEDKGWNIVKSNGELLFSDIWFDFICGNKLYLNQKAFYIDKKETLHRFIFL